MATSSSFDSLPPGPSGYSEKLSGLPNRHLPDLSISLEELNGAWASLKSHLRNKHKQQQIPNIPWLKDRGIRFEDYYVDLTINYGNDTTKTIHFHQIFKPSEGNNLTSIYRKVIRSSEMKRPTRILVEGPAGYGKSTLARKLCYDHAKHEHYMRHFQLVILFHLREFAGTLEEMIANTLQLDGYKAEHMLEGITQNQHKILFILDGFDELQPDKYQHIIPLLQGNVLPQATVIVTSRLGIVKPEETNASVTNIFHCMDSRILMKGVIGENRRKFLQIYFKNISSEKLASLKALIKNKLYLDKQQTKNLFECPLFLLLLFTVAEEADIGSLETKTELFKQLFNFLLNITLGQDDQTNQNLDFFDFDECNPPKYVEMLRRFGSFTSESMAEGRYAFTEGEILRACGNNGAILNLGILTRSESQNRRTRDSWYEPVHLSFLEFSCAYYIWISIVRLPNVLSFSYPTNILSSLGNLRDCNLVTPFLFGLCGKQLTSMCSALLPNRVDWIENVAWRYGYRELLAESKLQLHELTEIFLPLAHTHNIVVKGTLPILLKETLVCAEQPVILQQEFIASPQPFRNVPMRVSPDPKYPNCDLTKDWCKLITNQNICINESLNENCELILAICEAHLNQQIQWFSNFLKIEGLFTDKPIHKIYYWFRKSHLADTLKRVTDLIHQEKVVSVTFDILSIDCTPYLEQLKEFLECANQSKELLDMKLSVRASDPLFIDLGGAEGKTWRWIELRGDIVPRVGLLTEYHEQNSWDIECFIRDLPSRIHTLCLGLRLDKIDLALHAFVQNDGFPMANNLRELRVTFGNTCSSLLCSSVQGSLNNLQVLAVRLSADFRMKEQLAITSILSLISNCPLLLRVELWDGCTEEFITTFLKRFKIYPAIRNQGLRKTTYLHLNTLMLSPVVSSKADMPESKTANLAKELLMSGSLQHLWVSCTKHEVGYAKREFLKLFTPEEGFICVLSLESSKNDNFHELSEGDGHTSYIFKISAQY